MKEHEEKIAKLIELTEEIERRKSLYDELEKLTLELKEAGFTSGEFKKYPGKEYALELVDNFSEKNVAWRMAAVRRWEIKVTDLAQHARAVLKAKAKKIRTGGA